MKGVISLKVGSAVSWKGENWIIEEVDRHERVLARRAGDGYREFLPISEVARAHAPKPPAGHPPSPDAPKAATDDTGGDPPKDELDERSGRWRRRLADRVVRRLPSDRRLAEEQKVSIDRTTKHFQDLCVVLQLRRGSPERAAATITLATEYGYSVATAYRNLAIVEEFGSADALQRSHRSDRGSIRLNKAQWKIATDNLDKYRFVPESSMEMSSRREG